MEATALTAAESICAKDHELKRVDWLNLGLLLLLAGLLHGWMIANTEVAARDSIGFIRYALHLEQYPWSKVIERCDQHPGYAVAVLALSYPARHFLGSSPETLALSAQLASCIAAVLMVIPLYFLTREFFDRRVAFAAAVLFKVLPVSLQVTSDGVSEATFLLFLSTSLLFSCQGLHRRSIGRFILAGFFGGLAYLTRPEGALIVAATGFTLLGLQVLPWCRWPWQRTLACGSGLALAAILTAVPYVAVIGNITNKPTAKKMMTRLDTQTPKPNTPAKTRPPGVVASPLMATLFGVWWCDVGEGKHPPWWWAIWATLSEIVRSVQYLIGIPALLGMWWFRWCLRLPGTWLITVLGFMLLGVLCWMTMVVGYVSERHTLLLVLIMTTPASAAIVAVGDLAANRLAGWLPALDGRSKVGGLVCFGLVAAAMLPTAMKPLHKNRAGHRAAGAWLAQHVRSIDYIFDPFAWAHFYSGRTFAANDDARNEIIPGQLIYIIIERSENEHARLHGYPAAKRLARLGQCVFRWEPSRADRKNKAEVVEVIAVPRCKVKEKSR